MLNKFTKYLITIILFLFAIFLILDHLYPLETKNLYKEKSNILYDRNGQILMVKLTNDGFFRFHTDKIPKKLKESVLLFEDRYFYYHFGINPVSILRAIIHNATNQTRIGASTITMQVARMINGNKRTYINKLKEMFIAIQLEINFTKDEILSFYFNLAPYGGNLEGVRSACMFYFNTDLDKLSYSQIALLSTIPKNPNKNRLDRISNIKALKNRVLKLLFEKNIISKSAYTRGLKEPFFNKRYKARYNAPEYSKIAFENNLTNSKLDLELQNTFNSIIKNQMKKLIKYNANNAGGIIIDNETMDVISFIQSHDENSKNGKNSIYKMKRNTGSTLKPFIFALGLENGLITPKKEMIDTKIFLNEYTPKNYYNDFLGIINASDSLTFSLNIPAINLNHKLKENSLYEFLKKANLVKKEKSFYGQSIALGSAEISLLNLAHLYTIFANNGILRPLNIAGKSVNSQKNDISLLGKQSAYLIASILSKAYRLNIGNAWEYSKDTPIVAFKTGTSYGSRDLYTIGVTKKYTIAVWIGNFDSSPTMNLNGANSASKIVLNMFKFLNQKENLEFMEKPDGIIQKEICLDVFQIKKCKNFQKDSIIAGIKLKNSCDLLRSEEIDFLLKNKIIDKKDISQSSCFEYFKNKNPYIASPYKNEIIISDSNNTKIFTKCFSYIKDDIYIKVDNKDFKKTQSGKEYILNLAQGKHKIKCLDSYSNQSEVTIQIRR